MGVIGGGDFVKEGLVLYLDAANPKSYPGTGNTWYDLSGNGNNTSIGVAEFSTNHFISIESPGYADRLEFSTPHSISLNDCFNVTSGGWSIVELIKIGDATYPESMAGSVISNVAYGTSRIGFDWNHGNSMGLDKIKMGVSTSSNLNSSYEIQGLISLDDNSSLINTWLLRTFYWDRDIGEMGVYVNGKYQGGIDINSTSGRTLYDGGGISWGHLYGWRHDGARTLMKVYNKVLTETEVKQNYNALKGRFNL